MTINVLCLVAVSLAWQPITSVRELDMRFAVAAHIMLTDADHDERMILMRLAYTESRYSHAVATCKPGTTQGGRGTYQVIPRTRHEWANVCTLAGAASVALTHVRESQEVCAHLPRKERLAVYAAGSCSSKRGRALSRDRVP